MGASVFIGFFTEYGFFLLENPKYGQKRSFLRESCEFLVNKKLKDLLLQQLENHVLVGTQLIVALLV